MFLVVSSAKNEAKNWQSPVQVTMMETEEKTLSDTVTGIGTLQLRHSVSRLSDLIEIMNTFQENRRN